MLLRGLPALPMNRAHQVWLIRDDGAISAQVLPMRAGGLMVVQLQQAIDGALAVTVSIEPAGGSQAPTGPVVLEGKLG